MGTSPPMQKAPTVKTLNARRVAAPASAAFPPAASILVPASLATALPETTIPLVPVALLGALDGWGALVGFGSCALVSGTKTIRQTRAREISRLRKRQVEEFKLHLPAERIAGRRRLYQAIRNPSCVTLAFTPEFRVLSIPVSAMEVGSFGWLNTLKKSRLKRSVTCSRIFQNLNADASWVHCQGPFMYWLAHGWRLSLNAWRCTVPLLNGIQTLLVSQNWETTVLAGAF